MHPRYFALVVALAARSQWLRPAGTGDPGSLRTKGTQQRRADRRTPLDHETTTSRLEPHRRMARVAGWASTRLLTLALPTYAILDELT